MSDLNFPDLREYVENHTVLPQFAAVETRARRHRRRRRIVAALSTLTCLLLVVPAVAFGASVLSHFYQPEGTTPLGLAGPAGTGNGLPVTDAPTSEPGTVTTAALVAVAAVDPAKVFELVDLCIDTRCVLQFGTFLGTDAQHVISPKLWPHTAAQAVSDARIIVTSATNVQVSAVVGNAPLTQDIHVVTGMTASTPARPVQLSAKGPLQVVRPGLGLVASAGQPPLSYPTLVGSSHGWWATGQNTAGEFSVSVSRDEGTSWNAPVSLGVIDASNVTGLTTSDGTEAYLLVQTSGQIQLYYTDDGGNNWALRPSFAGAAVATRMGLYETRQKKLVIWYYSEVSRATTFYTSVDKGLKVVASAGVGPRDADGEVVEAGGRLFALGINSAYSADGGTVWNSVYAPYDPAALASTS